jgi:hypothetical protein
MEWNWNFKIYKIWREEKEAKTTMAGRYSSAADGSHLRLSLGMPVRNSVGVAKSADRWEDRVPKGRPSSRHGSQNLKPSEKRRTYVKPASGGFGSSRPSTGAGVSSSRSSTQQRQTQQRQTMGGRPSAGSRPSAGR